MDLPPPEPAQPDEPEQPDDSELQKPPVCAVHDRPNTRRRAAALERERRELLAAAEEQEEDINIDIPAPDEDVSLKRADLRALDNANLLIFPTVS